jgi:hypothetical protein
MTVKEILVREIETLPEAQQTDVLTFVRFLKVGLADTALLEERFRAALAEARRQAQGRGITEEDIAAEIAATRAGS